MPTKVQLNDVFRKSLSLISSGSVSRVTVTDSVVVPLITNASDFQIDVAIKNLDTAETLYIGYIDSISAGSSSWPLSAGESIALDLEPDVIVYAISSAGSIEAAVMQVARAYR